MFLSSRKFFLVLVACHWPIVASASAMWTRATCIARHFSPSTCSALADPEYPLLDRNAFLALRKFFLSHGPLSQEEWEAWSDTRPPEINEIAGFSLAKVNAESFLNTPVSVLHKKKRPQDV